MSKETFIVSEGLTQKAITDWLDAKRIFWKRMSLGPVIRGKPGAHRYSKNPLKGFPDLFGFLPGTERGEIFVIEVKKEKTGKLSPEQKQWRQDLESRGVMYIEARSLKDVISAFSRRFG